MTRPMAVPTLALALWLIGWTGAPPAAADDALVTGTVAKLDLERLRGLLTTDLGVRVFFEVPKAYLFENVQVGARVTLQLDDAGRAVKVMDTSLPDLLDVPPGARSQAGSADPDRQPR